MNTEELSKLHTHLLSALLEVDRICRAHEIKYFITGGTLLGAVRHHGFIPWDDDLDIGMLRSEYEKFLLCAKDCLDERFFLQTNHTDPEYSMPFCKIRVNGTLFVGKGDWLQNIHHGVYIDIFPIDTAPAGRIARIFHDKTVYFLKMAFLAASRFDPEETVSRSKLPLFKALRILTKPFKLSTLSELTERVLRMFEKRRTGWVVNLCGTYGYKKEVFSATFLDIYVKLHFEGNEVYTMRSWDEYLSQIYGDYMRLPPEDKRTAGHETLKIQM